MRFILSVAALVLFAVSEVHPACGVERWSVKTGTDLSGVLDGMNSEGLTVTMAMDDENFASQQIEPTYGPAPGLGVLQTLRMLLDTCATVGEAKEALLITKQYYEYFPFTFSSPIASGTRSSGSTRTSITRSTSSRTPASRWW
jgi:hypothetical protein